MDVAGAWLAIAQASIDQALHHVGADRPELHAARDLLAAPGALDVARLAHGRFAVHAGALDRQHVGVNVRATVRIDLLRVVPAGVDRRGADDHLRAAGVHDRGAAPLGQHSPDAARLAFLDRRIAVDDFPLDEPAFLPAPVRPDAALDPVALDVHPLHNHQAAVRNDAERVVLGAPGQLVVRDFVALLFPRFCQHGIDEGFQARHIAGLGGDIRFVPLLHQVGPADPAQLSVNGAHVVTGEFSRPTAFLAALPVPPGEHARFVVFVDATSVVFADVMHTAENWRSGWILVELETVAFVAAPHQHLKI